MYFVAKWLEALAWRLSQPGFDPSYGEILSSHPVEFWNNETDLSVDDYIQRILTIFQISFFLSNVLMIFILESWKSIDYFSNINGYFLFESEPL